MNPRIEPDPAPKISAAYRPPEWLDTVILMGPNGVVYELPAATAAQFAINEDRLRELGHPPFARRSREPEIRGHHKIPGSAGAAGTDWSYHATWEYGCFQDAASGGFAIGFHRHPFGDERAVAAEPQDFA